MRRPRTVCHAPSALWCNSGRTCNEGERMTDATRAIVPLPLAGALHETIWGGRVLAERLGKALPADALVGESWETADESLVREGPYAGEPLAALVARLGVDLLGWRSRAGDWPRFPPTAQVNA